jgi:cation diffusion facilitator family transporter
MTELSAIDALVPPGSHDEDDRAQRRTALFSILAAAVLVVLKLGTGLLTGSLALISAGIESSGDVVAALLTLLAIRTALRPADEQHNYGHQRAQNLAALGEAAIIAFGGSVIAFEAIRQLASGDPSHPDTHWYVFLVIAVAIVIDVSRIVTSVRAARRFGSAAFRSNAFNFAGDLAGSLAVLVGLVLVAVGIGAGDAIAALFVSCVIFYAVYHLITENGRELMDYAPEEVRDRVIDAIAEVVPRNELRRLRLREVAGRAFADVTIALSPATAVAASHDLADRVEQAIRRAVPASDVVVHVEPQEDGVELRERILATALADPGVSDAHDIGIFSRRGRSIVSLHLKLPLDRSIADAHEISERVEAAILALGEIDAVHTHLEPLEQPIKVRMPNADLADRVQRVRQSVIQHNGHEPRELQIIDTGVGPVLFLAVAVPDDESLPDAHTVASELEVALRKDHPDLVEVVVHTEPS